MIYGPNPDSIYPNEAIKSICYIKNVVTRPNIIIGDYTYYDDIMALKHLKNTSHITMNL